MKKIVVIMVGMVMACGAAFADAANREQEANVFVHLLVQSLIDGGDAIAFPVADSIFAIDNGERVCRAELLKVWPQISKDAFTRKVTVEQFFRDVDLRMGSPLDNKRLMSNKRLLESYKHQDGDIYCDASHVKDGVENFIGYDKAFIYIIRMVDGKWTLIGIGG